MSFIISLMMLMRGPNVLVILSSKIILMKNMNTVTASRAWKSNERVFSEIALKNTAA
jgi:hypothetical protein